MDIFDIVISLMRELVVGCGLENRLGEEKGIYYLTDGFTTKENSKEFGTTSSFILNNCNGKPLIEMWLWCNEYGDKYGKLEYFVYNENETLIKNGLVGINEIDKSICLESDMEWLIDDLYNLDFETLEANEENPKIGEL